jgi:hypothetical protein
MFTVARRFASTAAKTSSLLPPNIAELGSMSVEKTVSSPLHPENFAKIKTLYKHLPKGPAPQGEITSFGEWYRKKYFETESPMPLIHFIVGLMAVGYVSGHLYAGVSFFLELFIRIACPLSIRIPLTNKNSCSNSLCNLVSPIGHHVSCENLVLVAWKCDFGRTV